MKTITIKIRILLAVVILLSIVLFGCSSNTSTEAITTSTPPDTKTTPKEVDKPRLSNEEAASLIFSTLSGKLPAGYKPEQFDPDTRKVLYTGNGKWEFTVKGAGKEVTELPEEKIEKSEILWTFVKKEAVTTFDLVLLADYFENTGICEIIYLNKKNEVTSTNTVSEREIETKVKVKLIALQYSGNRLQVQVTLENTGYIPINGITMSVVYDRPVKEVSSGTFKDTLYPEKTAILLTTFEDEHINSFGYPIGLTFSSGLLNIPFTIDANAKS